MGRESHFSSKKPRVFVRAIQGDYSLKEELARLRSMPRVLPPTLAPASESTTWLSQSGRLFKVFKTSTP